MKVDQASILSYTSLNKALSETLRTGERQRRVADMLQWKLTSSACL